MRPPKAGAMGIWGHAHPERKKFKNTMKWGKRRRCTLGQYKMASALSSLLFGLLTPKVR